MRHYEWTELDYVAGAAHAEGMSYGQYVSKGMPNLERFKRRADAGEFDNKPVRAKNRRGTLTAVAAQKPQEAEAPKEPEKPKRPVPRPEHLIKAGKCKDCGAVLPPEKRAGPARKLCPACALEHKRKKNRRSAEKHRERMKAAMGMV